MKYKLVPWVYGTRRFNATFTIISQLSVSWSESIQFIILIPISLKSILILSSHLCQGHPRSLFPVGLLVKILKALLPYSFLATCPAHIISYRFNHPGYIICMKQTIKLFFWNLLHSHPFWAQIFDSGSCF